VTDRCGRRWGDRPPKRARKIFLNVSKNKSSERKLISTFWYSRRRFWYYIECINIAASGGLRPLTLSGDSAPCTPAGCTAPKPPLRPQARTSGSAIEYSSSKVQLSIVSNTDREHGHLSSVHTTRVHGPWIWPINTDSGYGAENRR